MRVVWLTDIHLNFLAEPSVAPFLDSVKDVSPDAVLIGGDIAEAHDLVDYLQRIDSALEVPVYFVLGNHDYYHGRVADVRRRVAGLCAQRPLLHYLSVGPAVSLTPTSGLVGHDGWADARLGDYERSMVLMNDYRLIVDFIGLGKRARRAELERLGDEAAAHLARVLPPALAAHEQVYVLTHVPPFREACWHQGRLSNDEWAPHFTCRAVGEALLAAATDFPHRQLTVLCGHTHGAGQCRIRDNLVVFTGGAEYCRPEIQRVFDL